MEKRISRDRLNGGNLDIFVTLLTEVNYVVDMSFVVTKKSNCFKLDSVYVEAMFIS